MTYNLQTGSTADRMEVGNASDPLLAGQSERPTVH